MNSRLLSIDAVESLTHSVRHYTVYYAVCQWDSSSVTDGQNQSSLGPAWRHWPCILDSMYQVDALQRAMICDDRAGHAVLLTSSQWVTWHYTVWFMTACRPSSDYIISAKFSTIYFWFRPRIQQEAQLPQRNSASAVHVYVGWLTDRAMHRTPQNRRGCTISDIQTLWFKKCWPKTHFVIK